ncbi:hypothetical protein BD413DRAFT_148482 [Trametes elegans]|nr:hypothetical protein BD413DRAFT_148482 [Trametes elegans]
MAEQPRSESRLAPAPFNKSNADLILRSSDRVEFRVWSRILLEASPVFETMLSPSQPPSHAPARIPEVPLVDLPEDGNIVEELLRLCYPLAKPEGLRPPDEIEPVLRAALKYDLELPIQILKQGLRANVECASLSVWAVACRLRFEDVAREAAASDHMRVEKDFPLEFWPSGISAGDYFRLLEYLRLGELKSSMHFLSGPSQPPVAAEQPAGESEEKSSLISPIFPQMSRPDLVCRTSDGAEFRTERRLLSCMFPTLLPPTKTASSLRGVASNHLYTDTDDDEPNVPTVQLQETARSLAIIFGFYNLAPSIALPSDPSALGDVLVAGQKYGLTALCEAVKLRWTAVVNERPIGAYLAAIRRGLHDRAKEAALSTINVEMEGVYVPELEDSSALAYDRLLTYHKACRDAATTALHTVFPPSSSAEQLGCGHRHAAFKSSNPWVREYTAKLCERTMSSPRRAAYWASAIQDTTATATKWRAWYSSLDADLRKLSEGLRKVSKNVGAVALNLEDIPSFS